MVDLLTRAADLLVFFARVNLCGLCLLIFIVILVFFSCFPPPFLLKQLWAFISLEPPRAFVVLQAFPEFEEYTFLLAGATFICILGLEVLFFNNGILFLFQPPSRHLRTCSKHHYGPFGCPCLWWLWPGSFMEVMMVFCSLHVDSCEVALLWCVEVFPCV